MEDKPVEIKDLNKTQLILLALLLSFVTSIATGITTVTLLQQAPTGVTQTINRVVQNTIEKVVPDYVPGKTQTVVVKEDDLVVDAVSKTRASMVSVLENKDAPDPIADAYSLGGGLFVASGTMFDMTKMYGIKVADKGYDAKVIGVSPFGFALLLGNDDALKAVPKIVLGRDATIKAGQTAVLITSAKLLKGSVQALVPVEEKDASGKVTDSWNVVKIDPEPTASLIGALAVDLDGDAVGMVLPKGDGAQIVGIDTVAAFVSSTINPPAPAPTTPATPTS